MQVSHTGLVVGKPAEVLRRLGQAAALLALVLVGAALIFWLASQWGHLGPDARLWVVRGVLIGAVLAAAALAWRGSRGVGLPAGLAAVGTGALLALIGQIYQTGADTWTLFLLWAALTLPWLILLRAVFPWLLCATLLNLAFWLYLSVGFTSWLVWAESGWFLCLAALNAGLLILAELVGGRLDDPWRLARRLAAAALLLGLWMANLLETLGSGDGPNAWLTLLSVVVLAGLYWTYAHWRRDLAVVALSLLAGLGLIWLWLWPHTTGLWTELAVILVLLGIGLAALALLRGLWLAAHRADAGAAAELIAADAAPETQAPGDPWFLSLLRVGILGFVVLLLVGWVTVILGFRAEQQALILGVILLVLGLWLARLVPQALGRQLGEVLAGVGLILAAAWAMFFQPSLDMPVRSVAVMLILGGMVFLFSSQQTLRFAAALAVLGVVLWLTWPVESGRRSLFSPFALGQQPSGLMLRLWWCQAGGVLAWVLSLRADRRALWRPVAWALLLFTPPLAWLAPVLGASPVRSLQPAGFLASLMIALLPGLVLGAWLAAHRVLPPLRCWFVALILCLAGLGWLDAPGVSVALTWILLGRLAGHRLLQFLGAASLLFGLYLFYMDSAVPLADKAWGLGLAGLWLLAASGIAAWADRSAVRVGAIRRVSWQRSAGVLAAGALTLGVAQAQIHHYRSILADGREIVLQLVPVDPRSLMQGDYMTLDYAVRQAMSGWLIEHPAVRDRLDAQGRGWLLLQPDAQGVWQLLAVAADAPSPAADVVALAFHWRSGAADWGARAWFFPEGQGERLAQAHYGVLRVAANGTALLAGLLDEGQAPL